MTSSLAAIPEGKKVTRILTAAIEAVDPGNAVRCFVRRKGSLLWVGDKVYDLKTIRGFSWLGRAKPAWLWHWLWEICYRVP